MPDDKDSLLFDLDENELELDDLLSCSPKPKNSSNPELKKTVSGTLSGKIKILKEAIAEISQEIEERRKLSKNVLEKIDSDLFTLEYQLKELKHYVLGHNHSIEFRRLGLEREILGLKKEKRSEAIREWEDISSLLRKRRDLIMEYQSLKNSEKMLAP